ncbi:AAA domain-containing protein [Holdemanella biformis]|uniref:AAA domain-containing protein n=1 Tax=Holdemanella biformis TaxID=1735 RepID=UPI001C3832C4|nr:AAA domain-containing protein [Holdemanella biformis]MBV4132149.1 AAA family ATPase [Holdemanella biformis]MBV4151900.1 AAA family ATPase [Holdemanella biformis]
MDTRCYMVIIKGVIKTSEIKSCDYNRNTQKWDVKFKKGKKYSYIFSNVERLINPVVLNPNMYRISIEGREFFNVMSIYEFRSKNNSYWHICFDNGCEKDYRRSDLHIVESCLTQSQSSNVFEYIKQIAGLSNIRNEETGEKLLSKMFDKISFVGSDVALAKYLNPSSLQGKRTGCKYVPIFPFGCNNSQYTAVKNAMENQISVIQGPPGTGKTQTILNIIANILMQGKTVQIVSNNNSAIENVYEKLSSPRYNVGFVVAALGSSKNKKLFVEHQDATYPDFSSWKTQEDSSVLQNGIAELSSQLKNVFDKQEKLACLRQELSQLVTEQNHFNQYIEESEVHIDSIKFKKKLSSKQWMLLWQECQLISEEKTTIGFWFKIKALFKYGVTNWGIYKQDISKAITTFQAMFYRAKQSELSVEIADIEKYLNSVNKNLLEELCNQSMVVLKDKLARKYEGNSSRKIFSEDDLWKNSYDVLAEYPVILSTTFSSRNSLNLNVVYDYLIMDEASQVDIATGALALSCAKNVVIVGDTKQLPNVVTNDIKTQAKSIFDDFNVSEGYQYTNSFLQSILDVMPNVTQTLLREHYRCHPKIINFCNQKFYHGELIIMTTDKGEDDVLSVVKTVVGNHVRNHYSQRQIDVIKNEIIPKYVSNPEETGIIAPYKNQVEALRKEITGIDAATVHKFQGKEKENIIISTVDDEISDFADDPYLINVAVSRAKKKLMLVVTGNEQTKERNITELIDYIQYNNFEVADSKIYSIFDYLYKQYTKERQVYLQKHKKVSKYDSENLMYSLIEDIICANKYSSLDVVCNFPLNMLIKNPELLNEQECRYALNPATHLDYLIYNRIGKKPVLAIEVDGYSYHKEDTIQASRDLLKNHIMELYEIPLLRFKTNGSGEKDKIVEMLDKLV